MEAGRSPSQDEYSQFDMGEDDLFGAQEDGDELGEYEQYEDEPDEEDSSSSGCEPDMVNFTFFEILDGVSVFKKASCSN